MCGKGYMSAELHITVGGLCTFAAHGAELHNPGGPGGPGTRISGGPGGPGGPGTRTSGGPGTRSPPADSAREATAPGQVGSVEGVGPVEGSAASSARWLARRTRWSTVSSSQWVRRVIVWATSGSSGSVSGRLPSRTA